MDSLAVAVFDDDVGGGNAVAVGDDDDDYDWVSVGFVLVCE